MSKRGMLDVATLKKLVAEGEIDTVLVVFPDMQGRIVGKRHIPLNSALYREGEQQFRSNLAGLLGRESQCYLRAAVITFAEDDGPTEYLGTLAHNGLAVVIAP